MVLFNLISCFINDRGKRKLAQVTKEAKEQLADLQSKLEMAHAGRKVKYLNVCFYCQNFLIEMTARDEKIQGLEKDIEGVRGEVKTSQESQV